MKTRSKLTKERKGAYHVADLLCDALDKLPKSEQEARIRTISKIKVTDRRSNPKRISTQPKIRRSRPTEAPQYKLAHR